jgi:hypothetical protein
VLDVKVGLHVITEALAGTDDQILERVIDRSTTDANRKRRTRPAVSANALPFRRCPPTPGRIMTWTPLGHRPLSTLVAGSVRGATSAILSFLERSCGRQMASGQF